MEEDYSRKILVPVIFILLAILSFFVLRPILMAVIIGIILAFVFNPIYKRTLSVLKSKNLTSFLICLILISLILLPLWFLTPILVQQSFRIFQASQQIDFLPLLKNFFPTILSSEQIANEVSSAISSFTTKATNYFMNSISGVLLNLPKISLQLLVVFFTFFYILRDQEIIVDYIKDILPFSKEVEKKLFNYSKDITVAVVYGQIIIGFIQGAITGLGFFIFGVPNALLFTILATLGAIFPIVGPVVVWVPVMIYLLIAGNNVAAVGVLSFGLVASTLDNIIRPLIISQRTKIHSLVILIGMIGGLFLFGILGFILGPLILAYFLVLLEVYRNKKSPGLLIQEKIR